MSDKYLNVDLNDPRASAIAEVMTNKTCKKILELLAEKELSGGDISSALGIPLNTVGYNIEKLLKAGLIKKSKNFFWSVKGKKIPTYSLSNKKILISPKRMVSAAPMAMIVLLIGALAFAAIFFATQNQNGINSQESNLSNNDLKQFSSYDELKEFLQKNTATQTGGVFESFEQGAIATATRDNSKSASSAGSADYSQTNVQVVGVDEPDFVKNDGKYIYTANGNKVVIVDAYPAEKMHKVSEIDFNGSNIQSIFVNGNKLIVFENSFSPLVYSSSEIAADDDIAKDKIGIAMPCYRGGCGGYGNQLTNVLIYDISDRTKPTLERKISAEGNFVAARMIGDYVYLVANEYINNENPILPFYSIDGVESKVQASEIYYPNFQDSNYVFSSIFAININENKVNSKVYLTGSSSTIYVSERNIYLTYTKSLPYQDYHEMMIKEAILPLLPDSEKQKVEDILNSDKQIYEKNDLVTRIVQEYSFSLKGNDKEQFDNNLKESVDNFALKMSKENEKTIIHKINIDKEKINYEGNGEVIGHLLNQFSMDEYQSTFRVATTTGESWTGNSLNHVFVLDKNLKIIGSIQDIAPGETIYSARFLGNRAYLVTFKSIDPFFVIDLSDAKKPKILGYLKIPGYSQYLHPYDENHIIGIGKDVNESIDADKVHSPNAVYYTAIGGVKISIFDVRDVEHPKETAKISIGDQGSDSYALQDHKAFLFDKSRDLLVIPITVNEIKNVSYYSGSYEQSVPVWQGAYVFNITMDSISYRGRITHFDDKSTIDGNQIYDYRYQVQRSLFIDNSLYTLSASGIKANDLQTIKEISKINLPNLNYYDRPILY